MNEEENEFLCPLCSTVVEYMDIRECIPCGCILSDRELERASEEGLIILEKKTYL
jgi:transcription initiation factor IIE alpha subunit